LKHSDTTLATYQYEDDTILCIQDDKEQTSHLKLLLYLYESMSGLKINFSKSEAIMISQDDNKNLEFSNMFNCAIGKWPIKYVGVPVAGSRFHVTDWIPITDKFLKRLDGLPVYAMSMYWLPVTTLDKMDTVRKRFFWQGGFEKEISFGEMD
jgi:hypothetical protein